MKESEYILATNRAKIAMALYLIRDVLAGGPEYGVSEYDRTSLIKKIKDMNDHLVKAIGNFESEKSSKSKRIIIRPKLILHIHDINGFPVSEDDIKIAMLQAEIKINSLDEFVCKVSKNMDPETLVTIRCHINGNYSEA